MSNSTCSFDGCANPRLAKCLCSAHYKQLKKGKGLTPLSGMNLSVEDRLLLKIKKTDSCWEWLGVRHVSGYGQIRVNYKLRLAHRVSYETWVGELPQGMDIDHACRNRACVNPDHLRPATRKQNVENHSGAYSGNKTGLRGVSWDEESQSYVARVRHNGQNHFLGRYSTAEEAGEAARLKRLELFTHNDLDR